jgi:hypothetical protein
MDWGLEMIAITRFAVGVVIAGVSLASMAGCRRDPSTASRSAAAYDEARRSGTPVEGSGGHGHGAAGAAPAGDEGPAATETMTDEAAHAGHRAADRHRGHAATAPRPADHAAMGHDTLGHARPSSGGRAIGTQPAGHAAHAGGDHAGMGHATPSGSATAGETGAHGGHATAGVPPSTAAAQASGHQHPAPTAGHAAMGHAASPAPAPSPETPSSTARPGQPAATLRADGLDGSAATAVQDAARSAAISREVATGAHAMSHGAYRQVDAGREDVPATSPTGDARRGSAPATDAAGGGHEGHGTTGGAAAPAPKPDPHAGHRMPSPRPAPSPAPKENR